MVRVLLFHYFKSQLAFSNSLQPTSLASTKDFLFLATGGMQVLVYSLEQPNFPFFCQFPTISKPIKLVCNKKARCVVTVERKIQKSRSGEEKTQTFCRAYFNWFEANSGEAVRTYVAGHSLWRKQEAIELNSSFIALEIPAQSVNAISCCPTSGNIAVASQNKVSVFRWRGLFDDSESVSGAVSWDFEHFVDIEPSLPLRDVVLSDTFIAFRSNLDVQVLKLVVVPEEETSSVSGFAGTNAPSSFKNMQGSMERFPWSDNNNRAEGTKQNCHQTAVDDSSCVTWSFDHGSSSSCSSMLASQVTNSSEDVLFPIVRKEPVYKDFLPEPKEVLGPAFEVPGHPTVVAFAGLYAVGIAVDKDVWQVKGITMLYRRFREEQLSNEGNDAASLHSLQLLPSYTQGITHIKEMQRSLLVPRHSSDPTLCGMCCLVSSPKEGHMYDVFSTSKLLSYYKYTCDTLSVSVCNGLLHAITHQGLETYTVRVYAAASAWVRENAVEDSHNIWSVVESEQSNPDLAQRKDHLESSQLKVGDNSEHLEAFPVDRISVGSDLQDKSGAFSVAFHSQSPAQAESKKVTKVPGSDITVSLTPIKEQTLVANTITSATVKAESDLQASRKETEPAKMKHFRGSHSSRFNYPNISPDIRLTVDSSGRTMVRFSTASRSASVHSGDHLRSVHSQKFEQSDYDSESDTEFTGSQRTRMHGVMSHSTSSARVSSAFYQAAVKKLSSNCGWMVPVLDLKDLREQCPLSSLDICLIGMYPFAGVQYVSATDGGVILFTRATNHDGLHRSRSFKGRVSNFASEQGDWKVYVLQNMDPIQLYRAVMPLANRCQKHNAQAYHHLVCEQHLFLRSLCVIESAGKEDKQRKKLRKLLCESAANLAELFARTPKVFKDCADYYTTSNLSLRDIVDRAWKSGLPVGKGLIYFLDQKLFGSDETVAVSESTAKRIFKLYSKGKPSRVAEIILMSSLNGFSPDTALAALEDLRRPDTSETPPYRLTPLDNLARAVLYLHQCEPDQAQDALLSIPKEKLVDVLTAHCYLLQEDGMHFTPLAQLLRKHQPKPFLQALLKLHDSKVLPLDTLLSLLGTSKSDASYNELAIGFMEAVLNDKRREQSFSVTVMQLSRIYLERIRGTYRKLIPPSHDHVPRGECYFGERHSWLNKLPPFQGSVPAPDPGCPRSQQISSQGSSPQFGRPTSLFTSPSRRAAVKPPCLAPPARGDTTECSCCCCNEDLMKLQALLCSKFVGPELCASIMDRLERQPCRGLLSLKLLCLPHLDRYIEAISAILDESPMLMLPYGIQYFRRDAGKWSQLLKILLDMCKEESTSEESDAKKRNIIEVLKGTLNQLCKLVTPTELLVLLPNDGSLGFFLPYLQWCHRRCASESVSHRLMKGGKHLTNLTGLQS